MSIKGKSFEEEWMSFRTRWMGERDVFGAMGGGDGERKRRLLTDRPPLSDFSFPLVQFLSQPLLFCIFSQSNRGLFPFPIPLLCLLAFPCLFRWPLYSTIAPCLELSIRNKNHYVKMVSINLWKEGEKSNGKCFAPGQKAIFFKGQLGMEKCLI